MYNKKLLRLSILLLVLIIGMVIISGRGCPKRKRDVRIGSSIPPFMINAPTNLIASAISSSQINLTWQDNSNNEDGFAIERKQWSGGSYTQIETVGANEPSYSDFGPFYPATIYYYRVRAFNNIGDYSAYSNEASAATPELVWSDVSAGGFYTIAKMNDGSIWGWGRNDLFQLGLGDLENRLIPTPIGTDTDWRIISAGGRHNLALKENMTLWSWGNNALGQLGLGDILDGDIPYPVGTDSDWSVIATGDDHSLAIKTNGTIWSWGFNADGQLGLGDSGPNSYRMSPTQIGSSSDWVAVVAGAGHSLGSKTNMTLWAWGDNDMGQLGIRDTDGRTTPSQVYGNSSDWSIVVAGAFHTVALKTNNTLWSWGYNWDGQLGLGDSGSGTNRTIPNQVTTASDWLAVSGTNLSTIAAGGGTLFPGISPGHTLAIKTNGQIWAWGGNYSGQLGLGDSGYGTNRNTPTQIAPILDRGDWFIVTAGFTHSIAIKSNNTLWVWGQNSYGQLGLGDTIARNIPTSFGTPSPPTSLVTTVISSGQINLSWADNANNEEGFILERRITSTDYTILASVGQDAISYSDTNVTAGTVYYYRVRAYNFIGYSPYSNEEPSYPDTPSQLVLTLIPLSQIDLVWSDNSIDEDGFKVERKTGINGTYQPIATRGKNENFYSDTGPFSPGTTYYYRVRSYNAFGDSPYSNEVGMALSGDWSVIATGDDHSIGVKTTGTLWAWGKNEYGRLGDGTTTNRITPRQIGSGSDWLAVSGTNLSVVTGGGYHTAALKSNSTLWAWGRNRSGQLGDGTTQQRNTPRSIGTDSDWLVVRAGSEHTIGMKKNKTLWAWGYNGRGQLGLGNTNDQTVPMPIVTPLVWSTVCAGGSHTIGLTNNGTLRAWGWNIYGQLGIDSTVDKSLPQPVGTDSDWLVPYGIPLGTIAAGFGHSIALKTNNTLWTWGYNNLGQLGLDDNDNRTTPSQVGSSSDWSVVAAGYYHTITLKRDGTIWGWGTNSSYQLGLGDNVNRNTPSQIGVETDWLTADGGLSHSLGKKVNNTLWAWGYNGSGQLGLGDTIGRNVPTLVGE